MRIKNCGHARMGIYAIGKTFLSSSAFNVGTPFCSLGAARRTKTSRAATTAFFRLFLLQKIPRGIPYVQENAVFFCLLDPSCFFWVKLSLFVFSQKNDKKRIHDEGCNGKCQTTKSDRED